LSTLTLIICEGKSDAEFFEKILKEKFQVKSKIVDEQRKAEKILRNPTPPTIIFSAGGKPRVYKSIKNLVSKLRSEKSCVKIGFFVDENREKVFDRLVSELKQYIQQPCKFHPVKPKLTTSVDGEITVKFDVGTTITIHVYAIPESLETQLKRKFNEKIEEKLSLTLLENEMWFKKLCEKILEVIK